MAITAGKQLRVLAEGKDDNGPGKANDIVYAGGIVMLDASGRAINGVAATGCLGVGLALTNRDTDRFDSTGLADGALQVRWQQGIVCVNNSAIAPLLSSDQPGILVYIEDNQTVSKTNQSSTLSPAGFFHHLDSDGVWVRMGKLEGALALDMTTVTDASAAHLAGSETFTGVKTFASGADPLFAKEANHALKVADSTTAATAGGNLTVAAGKSGTSGAGGTLALTGGPAVAAGGGNGGAASLDTGAKDGAGTDATLSLGATNAAAITFGRAGKLITRQGPTAAGASTDVIADPGTGQAIPVTQNGYVPIVTAGAETNTLAIPTFRGQRLTLTMDTRVGGDRVVTSAQRINQAGNTVMTFNTAADTIELVAITVAGALRWQVAFNEGVTLS